MSRTGRSDQTLAVPSKPAGRPDPRRLLDRSPSSRLTVVSAPAGSGKLRLIQEWLWSGSAEDRLDEGRVDEGRLDEGRADWVWIDLGPEDRDSSADVVAVCPTVLTEARQWLSAPERVRPRFVLTGLEMLTAEDVTRLVGALLDGLPQRVRVVLVSAGSGLPANCLVRLGDDLCELQAVDLWWSPEELVDQLARLTGIIATEAQAAALFRLTGGWPAGVIILGRLMRSGSAVLERPVLETVPEVLDFVTTEVLDRLPAPLRRFVLRTSVLDELRADDCAAVVPDEIPDARLAQVHRAGLTVARWPSPIEGMRYHPLVRAAARHQLRSTQTGAEAGLLCSAGEHARRQGRESAAVGYLAAGADWDAAMTVLLSAAGNGFRGWAPSVLRAAVLSLPGQVWAQPAERRALIAFAAAMAGDQLLAAQVVQQTPPEMRESTAWWSLVVRLIEALPGPAGGARSGYRAACSALVELQTLDPAIPIPAILGVSDRPSLIATAHLLAARAGVFDRDQAAVRRHLEAGWSAAGTQVPRYLVLAGLGADSLTAAWGGELAAAQRRAARAQRLAEESGLTEHPMLGLTRLARVEVLRARGQSRPALEELDSSATALDQSEPVIAAASGGRVQLAAAEILRALLHLDLGEPEAARVALDRLEVEGDDDPPRNLRAARAVAWARLHLLTDEVMAAERVLAAAPVTGTVVGARAAAALHRQAPEQAQDVLRDWPFEETLDNRIRRLLATAAIAIALDHRPEAGEQIDQALVAAEPDGHIQVFLEAPPQARALASAVLRRSLDSSGWRAELADRLDRTQALASAGATAPVTRRERAVLAYLTTTMTHAQIAAQLFVSDNTLKSHCRNLYRKLGVNTRADAIGAARARGWLASTSSSPEGEVDVDLNITLDPVAVEL